MKAIHNSLSDTSSLLRTLAKNAKSDIVRGGLLAVARGIDAANNDFVSQIEKILDEACGSCSDIVGAFTDAVNAIDAAADDAFPGWRDTPWVRSGGTCTRTVDQGTPTYPPRHLIAGKGPLPAHQGVVGGAVCVQSLLRDLPSRLAHANACHAPAAKICPDADDDVRL